jgi:hypothetical protein
MKTISHSEFNAILEAGIKPAPLPIRQWERFAEACYDQNTVEELLQALHAPADGDDCREWGITTHEWRHAIAAALAAKAYAYRNL